MLDNVDAVKQAHDSGDLYFGTVDTWILWVRATPGLTVLTAHLLYVELDWRHEWRSLPHRLHQRFPNHVHEFEDSRLG